MSYNSPIPCFAYNRILYLKKDIQFNRPETATILPFIDERSIKINNQTRNT